MFNSEDNDRIYDMHINSTNRKQFQLKCSKNPHSTTRYIKTREAAGGGAKEPKLSAELPKNSSQQRRRRRQFIHHSQHITTYITTITTKNPNNIWIDFSKTEKPNWTHFSVPNPIKVPEE